MGIQNTVGVDDAEEKLHIVIKEVQEEFEKILTTKETLIKKLGGAFENAGYDHSNICQEIKNVLRNEIARGLITGRLIEQYSLDKWKKKTKPKIERKSLLVHGTIDNESSLVISAWVTGVQENSEGGI